MYIYSNKADFIISGTVLEKLPRDFRAINEGCMVYGYCFANQEHYKNQKLDGVVGEYIKKNNIDISGVYCCLTISSEEVELCFDPMLQFNMFIYSVGNEFVASSSLDALVKSLGKDKLSLNEEYVFDQFAYQSPMRGSTLFNEISLFTFDNLKSLNLDGDLFPRKLHIVKPEYSKYSELSYETLLGMYIERLNNRASIISKKFKEVHIQLTGGADSRLVMSSFQRFENIYAYVYGDGNNQNRLIFEELLNARNVKRVNEIKLVGKPLSSPKLICKGLIDSNFLKFNNLNTYMNAPFEGSEEICKITGYYGANVCGGVVLPPENTSSNARLDKIPPELFTYHQYVANFKSDNSDKRKAAFSDLFYINNRGKGHYSSHTLADNKNINSVDILYDYINLLLVQKCPYSDFMIDKNAISVDLIYLNDAQLALFPYDSRKIPRYREFNNVPLINCFDGYDFSKKDLQPFPVSYPSPKIDLEEIYDGFGSFGSIQEMLSNSAFDRIFEKFPSFLYLRKSNDIQAMIFLYYCIAVLYMESQGLELN